MKADSQKKDTEKITLRQTLSLNYRAFLLLKKACPGTYLSSFLCAAAVLRLLFPFEFPFTYNVRIYKLWYGLHSFLNHHELEIFHTRIDYIHLLPILWVVSSSGKLIHSFYTWQKTMRAVKECPR